MGLNACLRFILVQGGTPVTLRGCAIHVGHGGLYRVGFFLQVPEGAALALIQRGALYLLVGILHRCETNGVS